MPFWYAPLEDGAGAAHDFPLVAVPQRPAAMDPSWGSHHASLRQILGDNRLCTHRTTAAALGIEDGDPIRLTSRHGAITATAWLVDGVEPGTVWTWNAIGKRGAWALPAETAEAAAGFLLDVLIDERLPPGPDGIAPANADPITRQAAWSDLRVRIEKAGPGEPPQREPIWAPLPRSPGLPDPPGVLDRGAAFAGGRP